MAFPTPVGAVTTAIGAATTSHAVNLPAGMVVGEGLRIIFATGADPGGAPTCSGCLSASTDLFTGSVGSLTDFIDLTIDAARAAASTATITTVNSVESAAIAYRIQNHNLSTEPGTYVQSNNVTATTASPDPGIVNQTADNFLIEVFYGADGSDLAGSPVYPSGYTGLASVESGASATTSCTVGAAYKQVNTASEDPGAFTSTLTAAQECNTRTIVLRAGTEGVPSTLATMRTMMRGFERGLMRGDR